MNSAHEWICWPAFEVSSVPSSLTIVFGLPIIRSSENCFRFIRPSLHQGRNCLIAPLTDAFSGGMREE